MVKFDNSHIIAVQAERGSVLGFRTSVILA